MFYLGHLIKNRPLKGAVFLFSCLLFSSCSIGPLDPAQYSMSYVDVPEKFKICHGYGCVLRSNSFFSKYQWQNIASFFTPQTTDPVSERQQIAKAIALMETYSGLITGTHTDVAGAGFKMIDNKQMDCIDETLNTNQYLYFLKNNNLLVWHDVAKPIRRGYFVDGKWPHNTATVRELESGAIYTIDSWFFKNGEEPWIIPAKQWLAGSHPQGLAGLQSPG